MLAHFPILSQSARACPDWPWGCPAQVMTLQHAPKAMVLGFAGLLGT